MKALTIKDKTRTGTGQLNLNKAIITYSCSIWTESLNNSDFLPSFDASIPKSA